MVAHYLEPPGRHIRVNHVTNPSFEIDASHWEPLNAYSVITVVDGEGIDGTKALRITMTDTGAHGQYGAKYVGPVTIGDVRDPLTTGRISVSSWMKASATASTTFRSGAVITDPADAPVTTALRYNSASSTTYTRVTSVLDDLVYPSTLLDNANRVAPAFVFEASSTRTIYLDRVMLTADTYELDPYSPDFIIGSRTDGEDGFDYAWTGTAQASTSTATHRRQVDLPDTAVRGADYTITGSGFVPLESVKVWVRPAVRYETQFTATAAADGTLDFTFTMPMNTGGTTSVEVAPSLGYPVAAQAVTIPAPAVPEPPALDPGEVVNYWPDPDLQTTNRTGYVAANLFPNPTPTVDLTHWSAVSGGSITRTTAAKLFPETSYGCRAVNGVKLTGATTQDWSQDNTFTGRVRASEAMTITVSGAMLDPAQTYLVRTVGWGDFGWGEDLVYQDGASKTFAAGETATFRIYGGENTSTLTTGDHNIVITLAGTGTFDVDGIVQWIGVDDGAGDLYSAIPDAPLFFSGDTPDDENFTYSWYGTAHDSASLQTANIPKYAWSQYAYSYNDELTPIPEGAFAVTKAGEKRVAYRSEIMFGRPNLVFTDGTVQDGFALPPGKYAMSFDYVTDYPVYFYGYPEPEWACNAYFYIEDATQEWPDNRLAYMPINGYPPYRQRMVMPFTATETSIIQPYLTTGQDWLTGDVYITNVAVFEIPEILHQFDYLPDDTGGIWDLTAMGVEAGKSYHANLEMGSPNGHPIFEYKVGAGSWTTLVESTLAPTEEPIQLLGEYFDFTVPADATEVRLRMQDTAIGVSTFDLFSSPPEFFAGDTADGGGYTYSWLGTPHDSPSVRSVATAGPAAQVWVAGTAKNVTEMRVVVAGTLVPITEAGA